MLNIEQALKELDEQRTSTMCACCIMFKTENGNEECLQSFLTKVKDSENYVIPLRLDSDASTQIATMNQITLHVGNVEVIATPHIRFPDYKSGDIQKKLWLHHYLLVGNMFSSAEDEDFGVVEIQLKKILQNKKLIYEA